MMNLIAVVVLSHIAACASLSTCTHAEAKKKDAKERSKQIEKIAVVALTPETAEQCEHLGLITQSSGGFFGQFTGGDVLFKEALRKCKEEASALDATHLQVVEIGWMTMVGNTSSSTVVTQALKCPPSVKGITLPFK